MNKTKLIFLFVSFIFGSCLSAFAQDKKIDELKQKISQGKEKEAITSLFELVKIYSDTRKYDEAITYLKQSLLLVKNNGDKLNINNYLGSLYFQKQNYDSSLHHFKKSLEISRYLNHEELISKDLYNVACAMGKLKQYAEANKLLNECLLLINIKKVNQDLTDRCYVELSSNCSSLGSIEEAQYYQGMVKNKELITLQNQKANAEKLAVEKGKEADEKGKQLGEVTNLLDSAKFVRDLIAKKLELEKKLSAEKENQLKNRNYVIYLMFAIIIIVAVFSFLLLRKYKENIRINKQLIFQKEKIEEQRNEIEIQRDQYKKLSATKDKFFSSIAHDLKNPFNTLIGFSDILIREQDTLDKDESMMYLNYINNSSKQSFSLLENLLQWARTQTKGITYKPTDLNLKEIADGNINLLNETARMKSIELSSNIDATIKVFGDKNMINTVIRNLISNSIKFTEDKGSISLSARDLGSKIEVTISDTGVGMSKETIAKLFKIDEYHSTPGTSQESGTGLGLIICKEFIERNGGIIWVESEVGKGSRFIFTLQKTATT